MTCQLAKKAVISGWKNGYLASLGSMRIFGILTSKSYAHYSTAWQTVQPSLSQVKNHSLGMGDVTVRISAAQLTDQTWFIQRRWKKRKREEERDPEGDTELVSSS